MMKFSPPYELDWGFYFNSRFSSSAKVTLRQIVRLRVVTNTEGTVRQPTQGAASCFLSSSIRSRESETSRLQVRARHTLSRMLGTISMILRMMSLKQQRKPLSVTLGAVTSEATQPRNNLVAVHGQGSVRGGCMLG